MPGRVVKVSRSANLRTYAIIGSPRAALATDTELMNVLGDIAGNSRVLPGLNVQCREA
jgi:hypothetical protein